MPKTGHFVLHANMLPTLTAGRYELLSEHTDLPFPVAPERTHVHVAAPRFMRKMSGFWRTGSPH